MARKLDANDDPWKQGERSHQAADQSDANDEQVNPQQISAKKETALILTPELKFWFGDLFGGRVRP